MGLFRKSRKGEEHLGEVRRCSDPRLVPWPGHYGLRNGKPDKRNPVEWDSASNTWRRLS